jgi:hypothetical protein
MVMMTVRAMVVVTMIGVVMGMRFVAVVMGVAMRHAINFLAQGMK